MILKHYSKWKSKFQCWNYNHVIQDDSYAYLQFYISELETSLTIRRELEYLIHAKLLNAKTYVVLFYGMNLEQALFDLIFSHTRFSKLWCFYFKYTPENILYFI